MSRGIHPGVRRLSAAALLLPVLQGCFAYAPVASAPVERGARVRVQLHTPQPVRLTELTPENVVTVYGEVIARESTELRLSVLSLRSASGREHAGNGETLRIPGANVALLERKRVSWPRTALLAAGLGLAVGGLWASLGGDDASSLPPPGGGGAPQ